MSDPTRPERPDTQGLTSGEYIVTRSLTTTVQKYLDDIDTYMDHCESRIEELGAKLRSRGLNIETLEARIEELEREAHMMRTQEMNRRAIDQRALDEHEATIKRLRGALEKCEMFVSPPEFKDEEELYNVIVAALTEDTEGGRVPPEPNHRAPHGYYGRPSF